MKLRFFLLCSFCCLAANCFSIDREAFTFTKYDLDVRVEPDQQRLAVRGKITLRNDSATPQKNAALQVSSSLNWLSIKFGGKPVQFVTHNYSSDIDHTGSLSEAVVTLPEAVPSKNTVELEIAYEGVIVLDATRLTGIGAPNAIANSTDWDQISVKFTGVRGVGYVAWYPIAAEAVDMAQGLDLFAVVGRWKAREAAADMRLHLKLAGYDEADKPELLVNATACTAGGEKQQAAVDCDYEPLGSAVPVLVVADYAVIDRAAITVHFLPGHDTAATAYADAGEKAGALVSEWFGAARGKAQTADLPDGDSPPFESGSLLLTPLASLDPKVAGLAAAHQLTHAAFHSPQAWINEGLAHFAQALYLERERGRQAAFDYMAAHQSAIGAAERAATAPRSEDEAKRSLINTEDEELIRSKAMCVWWMLRDMVGDAALKKALAAYRANQDASPAYMQRLIQAQTQKDLEWFFDDWVYRDRGLPDFKVESAFTRATLPEGSMVTITVANLGAAGAEVPVTVKFAGGEVTQRIVVRGKSNAVIRVPTPKPPEEIVVNDGSVPESDITNNTFKIADPDTIR